MGSDRTAWPPPVGSCVDRCLDGGRDPGALGAGPGPDGRIGASQADGADRDRYPCSGHPHLGRPGRQQYHRLPDSQVATGNRRSWRLQGPCGRHRELGRVLHRHRCGGRGPLRVPRQSPEQRRPEPKEQLLQRRPAGRAAVHRPPRQNHRPHRSGLPQRGGPDLGRPRRHDNHRLPVAAARQVHRLPPAIFGSMSRTPAAPAPPTPTRTSVPEASTSTG